MSITTPSKRPRRAAQFFYRGLRASGATALSRCLHDAALILCYHNVVASGDDGGDSELHMPVDRFERQVRWLAQRYEVISLRQLAERLAHGGPLRKVAAITFDDGYAGVFEHAVPLLASLGLPATVFVVADAPERSEGFWWDHPAVVASLTPTRRERWLTCLRGDGQAILSEVDPRRETRSRSAHRPGDWSAIKAAAAKGIEIGAHSASHRALTMLTDTEIEHEVITSRDVIHRASGVRPEFFAYPYGLWDSRSCAAVRRAGYVAGLGLDLGLNGAARDTSCLRRVNVPAGISPPAFEAWAAGLHFHRT
jgi:peptidoglycan/xylan/chitin deacetylase (PgdA/CDA1 family)